MKATQVIYFIVTRQWSDISTVTSMSKDRAFESLFLENYSSFMLTIECKEEFTLRGALSGHNQGKIAKKPRENICLSSYVCSEFHFQ